MLSALELKSQTDSLQVHTINGKEYYIHIIEKGESLYAIHKKYDIPIDVIKKENPGVNDGLSIGEKVFIPLKREQVQAPKNNGNFLNHIVKKKQTLYSISKLYEVQQKEIIAVNPGIENGLQEGQVIKIPVKPIQQNTQVDQPIITKKSLYKTHVVKKGETLYSLSKLYATTVDSIKLVNLGLTQGLREGETIFIPKKQDHQTLAANIISSIDTSVTKKATYTIALMLPFYLDENDEMAEKRNALEDKKIYPKSKFAIEFYNGFLSALDSITTDSCKFKVYAYDTKGKDTARIKHLLLKSELTSVDLIVGPLYYDNFKLVANYAKQHKIPVVSPVKQSNKVLLGNPYVFKVIPSKTSVINPIAKLMVDSFKTENLLAIAHEKSKEKPMIDLCVKAYNKELLSTNDTTIYSSMKRIDVNVNMADIVAKFKPNKNNVIFVPTSDQTFVTTLFSYLITTLNQRNYKDYKVTLIGLEEWSKYENIDLDYFQRLNVHYCASQYMNDKDSLNQEFIERFIQLKSIYPSKNVMLGHDIAYYFGNNFSEYGTVFSQKSLVPYRGRSVRLNFFKTGIESGFENKDVTLLRFYDYMLTPVY